MEPTIESLADTALQIARQTIEKGDENTPMWILFSSARKEFRIVSTPWQNQRDKAAMEVMVRDKIREWNIDQVIFICEAWCVRVPKGIPHEHVVPSEDDRREEVLLIHGEQQGGPPIYWQFRILRRDGQATLGEKSVVSDKAQIVGRFVHMFDSETKH